MYRCHSTVWVKQIPLRFCFNFSKTVGIMWVPFSEGPPPKICEGEKTSKIRRDFWQLSTLIAIIFGTDRHVESWRKTISNYNPFQVGPKNLVNFGPQTTESKWLILTNPSGHFSGDYILAIRGCCPLKFLSALEIDQGYLAHAPTGTPPPKKNVITKFKIWLGIQRLSLYNFHASGNILTNLLQETWWTLAHKQKSYSAHVDLPKVLVPCKLTQFHTPRGSRIQFTYSHSPAVITARGISTK